MRYALAALAVLAGCGSGGGSRKVTTLVLVDASLPESEDHAAETVYEEPTRIRIKPSQEFALRVESVFIHELVHAATGNGTHLGEGCYMDPNAGNMDPGEPPCATELEWMLAVTDSFTVRVEPEAWLAEAVGFAVEFWNDQCGRQMFTLEIGP